MKSRVMVSTLALVTLSTALYGWGKIRQKSSLELPQNPAAGGTTLGTVVDYQLPPGIFLGQKLKEFHESQVRTDVSPPFTMEYFRAVEQARISEFTAVSDAIDQAYQNQNRLKRVAFSDQYEAAKRDIARLREFAVNNVTFPVSAEVIKKALDQSDIKDGEYMATIIISQKQIDIWRKGMMSWGVIYKNDGLQYWPTGSLTVPPDRISQGGEKIASGDWRGAWLLGGGQVYVPGVEFFLQTDVSIERINGPE